MTLTMNELAEIREKKPLLRSDHVRWIGREELASKIFTAVVSSVGELDFRGEPYSYEELAEKVIIRLVGERIPRD